MTRAANTDPMVRVAMMLQEARESERARISDLLRGMKYPPEKVLQNSDRLIYNTALSDALQAVNDGS